MQFKLGAVLSFANIVVSNIAGIVITPLVVNSLGQREFGFYSLLGTIVGYLSILDFGITNTIIRYSAAHRARNDLNTIGRIVGNVLFYFIALGIIFFLVFLFLFGMQIFNDSLLLVDLLVDDRRFLLLIVFLNLCIVLPGNVFTAVSNGYERFSSPRVVMLIRTFLRVIVFYYIAKSEPSAVYFVLAETLLNVAGIFYMFYYVVRVLKVKIAFRRLETELMRGILKYSSGSFVLTLIWLLQWQGGQVLIADKLGLVDVGYYSIGVNLAGYYGAFAAIIGSLLLPGATRHLLNYDKERLNMLYFKSIRYIVYCLLLILSGFYFFGLQFIELWVGEAYLKSWSISLVLMLCISLGLVQLYANALVGANGKFIYKILATGLPILSAYILIFSISDLDDIIEITIVLGTAILIGQIMMNWYYHKVLKLSLKGFIRTLIRSVIPSLFLVVVIHLLFDFKFITTWSQFIWVASTYALVYSVLGFYLVLSYDDRRLTLRALFRNRLVIAIVNRLG